MSSSRTVTRMPPVRSLRRLNSSVTTTLAAAPASTSTTPPNAKAWKMRWSSNLKPPTSRWPSLHSPSSSGRVDGSFSAPSTARVVEVASVPPSWSAAPSMVDGVVTGV